MQNNEIYFSDESFASKREPGLDIALSRALLEQTSLKKYPIILRAYKVQSKLLLVLPMLEI